MNCKTTFEGVFKFTYEMNEGGGAECDSPQSLITACQEPGSPYVGNERLTMKFGKCPEVSSSYKKGKFCIVLFYHTVKGNTILSAIVQGVLMTGRIDGPYALDDGRK